MEQPQPDRSTKSTRSARLDDECNRETLSLKSELEISAALEAPNEDPKPLSCREDAALPEHARKRFHVPSPHLLSPDDSSEPARTAAKTKRSDPFGTAWVVLLAILLLVGWHYKAAWDTEAYKLAISLLHFGPDTESDVEAWRQLALAQFAENKPIDGISSLVRTTEITEKVFGKSKRTLYQQLETAYTCKLCGDNERFADLLEKGADTAFHLDNTSGTIRVVMPDQLQLPLNLSSINTPLPLYEGSFDPSTFAIQCDEESRRAADEFYRAGKYFEALPQYERALRMQVSYLVPTANRKYNMTWISFFDLCDRIAWCAEHTGLYERGANASKSMLSLLEKEGDQPTLQQAKGALGRNIAVLERAAVLKQAGFHNAHPGLNYESLTGVQSADQSATISPPKP